MSFTRRQILIVGSAGVALVASFRFSPALANDDDVAVVSRLIGGTATPSDRVRLVLPAVFPTGYTVPMSLTVDTAMTVVDHVRSVRVFAPRNPIVEIAAFHFDPLFGIPSVSTRIRLARPQHVIAVAQMNDDALLMAKTFVEVATDGCA